MSKVDNATILQTIKEDNLVLFSAYIEGKESLAFGRFPLLTICYMYEANKIIAKHRDVLANISKYTIVSEPYELYKKFRSVAGKHIRLYRNDDDVVSPLEMLAILKKDSLVKKYFSKFYTNERIKRNIKSIYKISSLKVKVDGGSVDIEHRPLEPVQKRVYGFSVILSAAFALLITTVYLLVGGICGFGVAGSPAKIYNERQLYRALNSGGNYVLAADINLKELKSGLEFSGNISGGEFIIFVEDLPEVAIISKNEGKISNLNIVYEDIDSSISRETSLLVGDNLGEISSVNILVTSMSLTFNKTDGGNTGICGFAINNSGTITGSKIMMSASISANGNGEGFASGFVINNSGSIKNCEFVKGSNIESTEVDVAGFSIENSRESLVYNCINDCDIKQISSLDGWSPSIAGISLTNYGVIEDSINHGNLTNNSNNTVEEAKGIVFIGGVSANNYGDIVKSMNTGDINVLSQKLMVYAGGVTAYSDSETKDEKIIPSTIENCGAKSDINIETVDEDAYVFVGGISGYLYGGIFECFSVSNISTIYDERKCFVGTALGAAKCEVWFGSVSGIYISAEENYVLNIESTDYQIGALIYQDYYGSSSIVPTAVNLAMGEIQTLEYESQIMQKEVYWSE